MTFVYCLSRTWNEGHETGMWDFRLSNNYLSGEFFSTTSDKLTTVSFFKSMAVNEMTLHDENEDLGIHVQVGSQSHASHCISVRLYPTCISLV